MAQHAALCCTGPRRTAMFVQGSAPEVQPVTTAIARPGLCVERGPDWKWADQDSGPGSLGRIAREPDDDEWVVVKWDHDTDDGHYNYRVGAEGCFDLQV